MVLNKYLLAIINIYDSIFEKSDRIEKQTRYFDYFEELDSSFRKFSYKSANIWGSFIWIRVVDVTIQYFYEIIKKLNLNIIFQIQWLRFRKHRGRRTCLAPPWRGGSHEIKTVSTWSESCSPQIHTSLRSPPVWLFGSWAFKVVIKANNISQFSYMFIDSYWDRVCLCSPILETLASSSWVVGFDETVVFQQRKWHQEKTTPYPLRASRGKSTRQHSEKVAVCCSGREAFQDTNSTCTFLLNLKLREEQKENRRVLLRLPRMCILSQQPGSFIISLSYNKVIFIVCIMINYWKFYS